MKKIETYEKTVLPIYVDVGGKHDRRRRGFSHEGFVCGGSCQG
jgi:hypothetical protein